MTDGLFVIHTRHYYLLTVSKVRDDTIMKRYRFALPSIIVGDRSERLVTVLLNTIEMLMSITRRSLDTYVCELSHAMHFTSRHDPRHRDTDEQLER